MSPCLLSLLKVSRKTKNEISINQMELEPFVSLAERDLYVCFVSVAAVVALCLSELVISFSRRFSSRSCRLLTSVLSCRVPTWAVSFQIYDSKRESFFKAGSFFKEPTYPPVFPYPIFRKIRDIFLDFLIFLNLIFCAKTTHSRDCFPAIIWD